MITMIIGVKSPPLNSKSFINFVTLFQNSNLNIEINIGKIKNLVELSLFDLIDHIEQLGNVNLIGLYLPSFRQLDEEFLDVLEKAIILADEVNIKVIILPLEVSINKKVFRDISELLLSYNKTLCIEAKVDNFERFIAEFEDMSSEHLPITFGICYNTSLAKNRPVITEILENLEYIRFLHVSNFTQNEDHLPLFSPKGLINPYELLESLIKSFYNGYLVLDYDTKFISQYRDDISRIKQYIANYFEREF